MQLNLHIIFLTVLMSIFHRLKPTNFYLNIHRRKPKVSSLHLHQNHFPLLKGLFPTWFSNWSSRIRCSDQILLSALFEKGFYLELKLPNILRYWPHSIDDFFHQKNVPMDQLPNNLLLASNWYCVSNNDWV